MSRAVCRPKCLELILLKKTLVARGQLMRNLIIFFPLPSVSFPILASNLLKRFSCHSSLLCFPFFHLTFSTTFFFHTLSVIFGIQTQLCATGRARQRQPFTSVLRNPFQQRPVGGSYRPLSLTPLALSLLSLNSSFSTPCVPPSPLSLPA